MIVRGGFGAHAVCGLNAARDRCQFMLDVVRAASMNREIVGNGLSTGSGVRRSGWRSRFEIQTQMQRDGGTRLSARNGCDSGSNVKACLRTTVLCVWCVCVCVCVYLCIYLCVCVIAVAGWVAVESGGRGTYVFVDCERNMAYAGIRLGGTVEVGRVRLPRGHT